MNVLVTAANRTEQWPSLSSGIIHDYVSGKHSFLTAIMPAALLELDAKSIVEILQQRLGEKTVNQAFNWHTLYEFL